MYCEAKLPVDVVSGRGMADGGGWDDATLAGLPLERGAKVAGLPDWPVDANADGSAFEAGTGAWGLGNSTADAEVVGNSFA
jgi:hypothetical protein